MQRLSPTAVRDLLLCGLTFSSGAVDVISFLALGKVFTAFMTGNVVFLGMRAAGANGPDVVSVAAALAVFGTGVFLATRIVGPSTGSPVWSGRVTAALAATAVAEAAFLVVWGAVDGLPGSGTATVLVALSALAMGLQSGAVLTLRVRGAYTTAATATLMFLSSDLASRSRSATERWRLAGVLVSLLAGAIAGGLLLVHARAYAPLLPLVTTSVVIAAAAIVVPPRKAHHGLEAARQQVSAEPGRTRRARA
jgi:uncharacterized membrane protein YoaK (UPF0700 family)